VATLPVAEVAADDVMKAVFTDMEVAADADIVVGTALVTVDTTVVGVVVVDAAPGLFIVTVQSPSQLNMDKGLKSPAACLIVPVPQRFPLSYR
jgi:hypothetical protein